MSLLHCLAFFRSHESHTRQAHQLSMMQGKWCILPVHGYSAPRRQSQKDIVFKVSLRYTARTCFSKGGLGKDWRKKMVHSDSAISKSRRLRYINPLGRHINYRPVVDVCLSTSLEAS